MATAPAPQDDETRQALQVLNDALKKLRHEPETLRTVTDFIAMLRRRDETDSSLLATLENADPPPSAAHVEQLRRNAAARTRFLKEVPLLRSMDVARQTGSTARNESAKASRWKTERRIFSVPSRGVDFYPAFQFSPVSGEPLPVIRSLLEILESFDEWQTALWLAATNVWLDGERPMDVVERDPDAVLDAARHAVEPLRT